MQQLLLGRAGGAQWAAHEGAGGCGGYALRPTHGFPSDQGQEEGRAAAPDGPWQLLQRQGLPFCNAAPRFCVAERPTLGLKVIISSESLLKLGVSYSDTDWL